jgi:hypothetical protein
MASNDPKGPKFSERAPNDLKHPETVQNGPNWSELACNGLKWSEKKFFSYSIKFDRVLGCCLQEPFENFPG